MTYYIDLCGGREGADGLSPESARKDYHDLAVKPGDTILFKRGTFVRACLDRVGGSPDAPVTYGAYGEGQNPVFCGSVDVSDPAVWREIRPHIWECTQEIPTEACNFIFDGGRIGATLRWEEEYLCAQGDFYDSRFGCSESNCHEIPQRVLLYSEENPGTFYSHIECAVWGRRNLSPNVSCTICEDLIFFGSGVHAMGGGAHHMTVRRCTFSFIGGSVWNRRLKIRFGNAVEFWNLGEDILIEDCYFNNVYDSCITHQGALGPCTPARNLVMRHNLFVNYGMGAYEGRDLMSIDSAFNDNLCLCAGRGFSGFGDTKPRRSEIYPQPMGHHMFMWRIPYATEGGSLEVARNLFWNATGAAVYSIDSLDADAQMHLHDNSYYTDNRELLTRIGGKSYRPDEFERYQAEYGEAGARYVSVDIDAAVEQWFAESGCGRFGARLFTDELPPQIYFTGSTTRDPLSYRVGEPITFDLQLICKEKPFPCACFRWEYRGEDGVSDSGVTESGDGHFTHTVTLGRSGYGYLRVVACDAHGNALAGCDCFEGGACADFDAITQVGGRPADFRAYWERVIAQELDPCLPAELERKEFFCGDPGDVVYDIKAACPGGMPVSGYLRLPRDAGAHSLPIVLQYGGYGVYSAEIPRKERAIVFNINPHGIENGHPIEYYHQLEREKLSGFGFDREENRSPDTCYFKYVVLRAMQAVRYCMTLAQWDGVNVIVSGGSMGAFQAVSVAALQQGVTGLRIDIPWLCDLHGFAQGRMRGWRPECDPALDYYDTVSMAQDIACDTVISAGLGDMVCPPSGVTALYHAIRAPKELAMLQNRTHPYMPPEISSSLRSSGR